MVSALGDARMKARCQCGRFSNTSVKQLPAVKTRDIQTQAVALAAKEFQLTLLE